MFDPAYAFRSLFLIVALVGGLAAQDPVGTWFTDRGVLEIEADGSGWSGRYGNGFTWQGKKRGKQIAFTAKEGRAELRGTLQLDKRGFRFDGEWKSDNGKGTWRGWRHDPATEKGRKANVAGFWRTSWGLLELEQQGDKLTGGFGAQGWSKVRGKVKGRFVELDYDSPFGKGTFALDFDKKGQLAVGSAQSARGKYALQAQRLDGHTRGVAPKAGKLVNGLGKNRLVYYLHAPKTYKPGQKLPLLVILHGSNYVSKPYAESIGNTPIGQRYFVVGIDGEAWEDWSKPDDPRQNYTYVNFMGKSTYQGYPNTHRESPALVAELIEELQQQLGCPRTFVGGHSQGGFLTWFFAMHYPDLVDGVFPMSSGMTMQCEADVFDDDALKQKQRKVAIAVVHGRNDRTVQFKQGEGTYLRTREHGFPMLRLFASQAGHGFSSLPWQDAVEWLEGMTSDDPAALARLGQEALDEDRFPDAMALVLRLRAVAPGHEAAKTMAATVDEYAEGDLERFAGKLAKPGTGEWIDDFLVYRDSFEFADCARDVMASFRKLRTQHEEPAKKLLGEARGLFRNGDQEAGWKKYEQLVGECWASSLYPRVRGWLADRK